MSRPPPSPAVIALALRLYAEDASYVRIRDATGYKSTASIVGLIRRHAGEGEVLARNQAYRKRAPMPLSDASVARLTRIREMRGRGMTQEAIATEFGISRQRVQAIIAKHFPEMPRAPNASTARRGRPIASTANMKGRLPPPAEVIDTALGMRGDGLPLKHIAEVIGYTYDGARRLVARYSAP